MHWVLLLVNTLTQRKVVMAVTDQAADCCTHVRCQLSLRPGTSTSRYDMNITGYRLLSVTPLSLRRAPGPASLLSDGLSNLSHNSCTPRREHPADAA